MRGVRGAAAPCFMVWTMDYGPWSIFRGLWSMVHFGHHFPGKIARSIVFYSTLVPSGNSSPDFTDLADRADFTETVSGTTDQTLPSTGRSFRMTGVLNKLPQTRNYFFQEYFSMVYEASPREMMQKHTEINGWLKLTERKYPCWKIVI